MKKKFICLFLVLVMATSIFSTIVIASQRQDTADGCRTQGLTTEEMAAINAGTTLEELAEMGITLEELLAMDAEIDAIHGENFSTNQRMARRQFDLIEEGFMHARDGSIIHPDFYGGLALDSDGMPIIFIVESRLEEAYNHDTIGTFLEDGLRYRHVEVSYAELREAVFEISALTAERYTAYQCIYSYNVSSIFTDMFNNRVVVTLVEYNEHMIEGFRRYVYDSPILILRQGDRISLGGYGNATFCYSDVDGSLNYSDWNDTGYHQEIYQEIVPFNTTINTGAMIRRRILTGGGAYATAGFRVQCTWTGARGFLTTAGDTLSHGNDVIERGFAGRQIGVVRESIFRYGSGRTGMNASFVELTGSNQITNNLPNGRFLQPFQGDLPPRVGNPVEFFGGITGRVASGQITSTTFTLTNGNRQLFGMTLVERGAFSESGNSGGPVFAIDGFHVGLISGGDANRLVVVPMYRITSDFQSRGFNLRRW